jgi:TRAP-type uncharacterized transport system fused permease subunit
MFVFYYSVLSEVTPPTALAAVGASAITGGRTVPTMWQALKYALPAFLAPIAFVLTDPGEYLLGRGPVTGVLAVTAAACLGIAAFGVATGGWVLGVGPAGPVGRGFAAVGGLLLLYLHPVTAAAGVALLAVAVLTAFLRRHRATDEPGGHRGPGGDAGMAGDRGPGGDAGMARDRGPGGDRGPGAGGDRSMAADGGGDDIGIDGRTGR